MHFVLNYFRKATALHHKYPALIYGKYTLLDKLNPDIYAYTGELDGNKFLVLLNFSNHQA
jgi:oligo-1,6-glucosidase